MAKNLYSATASEVKQRTKQSLKDYSPGRTRTIKTPAGPVPLIPVLIIMIGAYLAWFGVHYWRDKKMKWPSDPVKHVLQGKGVPPKNPQETAGQALMSGVNESLKNLSGGDTGANTQTAQHNQDIAKLLAAKYGWSEAQNSHEWESLVKLWNQESGWSNTAQNPSSGAFGIAQALGHGSSADKGAYGQNYGAQYGLTNAEAKSANNGSATEQVKWGLGYINDRYGDPISAWDHEVSIGRY